MKKIIIDTDIADDIDDAYAIVLALKTRELDVLGISTVYRNSRQRALILKSLLSDMGDEKTPVYAGEDTPIKEPEFRWNYDTENKDGKVNLAYFRKDMERFTYSSQSAVEFYRDAVRKYPGEITFVEMGPLTNLAKFATEYPEEYKKLAAVHIMCGYFGDSEGEWNVKCDPESAEIALKNCSVPIKLISYDVTKETYLTEAEYERFKNCPQKAVRTLVEMTDLWLKQRNYKKPPFMHDGLAIAELTENFCDYKEYGVKILLDGERARTKVVFGDDYTFRALCSVGVRDRDCIRYIADKITG